jgi:hypothetical protein
MNRRELRKELARKSKKQLIDLIPLFREEFPHFKIQDVSELWAKDFLVSNLWGALLNTISNQTEYKWCLQIIVDGRQVDALRESEESSSDQKTLIITPIPFSARDFCNQTYQMLISDTDFLKKWNTSPLYFGYLEFLSNNNVSIPENLANLLFQKLFKGMIIKKRNFDSSLLIDYSRYNLEVWEKDLKQFFDSLNSDEIHTLLCLHLIYSSARDIYETDQRRIIYCYDDLPLLKRTIIAQFSKITSNNQCSDKDIEVVVNKIKSIYIKTENTSIRLIVEPWGELD